jgi:hypothetical protein
MAFGQTYEKKSTSTGSETRESPYLRLKPGERTVRVMDDDATMFWQYFIDVNVDGKLQGRSLIVAGFDNPIRRYMDSLGEGHPKHRRPSRRFVINVIDRTPVIRAENGGTVYPDESGKFAVAGDPRPNNRMMILEFGPSLMESLLTLHNRMRNLKTGEQMAIQQFDIQIFTRGQGRDTTKSAIPSVDPDAQSPLPAELANAPRYDLKLATRPLPDEAQTRLLDGEDYAGVIRSLGWEPIKPLW